MKKRQKNPSKGPIVPPSKPVDFTARSGNGLGDLGRFPREIRNMIYSSLMPQVMPHAFEHKIIDRFAVRKLVNAPILATSKQLCVEFLEVFIREVHLEEDDDNNEDPTPEDDDLDEGSRYRRERPPNCLERLLAFVEARIDFAFSTKRVGIVLNTVYLCSDLMKHLDHSGEGDVHRLPQPLQRLWDIHEKYGIPSDQIYIKIDYWEPSHWIASAAIWNKRFDFLPCKFWYYEFESVSGIVALSDRTLGAPTIRTKYETRKYTWMACPDPLPFPAPDSYAQVDLSQPLKIYDITVGDGDRYPYCVRLEITLKPTSLAAPQYYFCNGCQNRCDAIYGASQCAAEGAACLEPYCGPYTTDTK